MLPCPIASQGLKSIARRHPQIVEPAGGVQQQELAPDHALDRSETPDRPVVKQVLSVFLRE